MRCILNSGGMDSYLTWWHDHRSVDNVYIDIDHSYMYKEVGALDSLKGATSINGSKFSYIRHIGAPIGNKELPSGIIPNRNAYLILAASNAGYSEIMMGVLHGEINSDKSLEFMDAMQTVLDISWRRQYWNKEERVHKIWSPIRSYTKSQLVRSYLDNGGDKAALLQTVSCYSNVHQHCGRCPSCFKRWVALTNNNIEQYWVNHPLHWVEVPNIVSKAKNGTYSESRAEEILSALKLCQVEK